MKKKRMAPRLGPKALTGSALAKRQTVVLLEVLSGVRGPQEASQALGVSLTRYYALETRALQAMITSLEPRPKGRQLRPEDERERLRSTKRRLEQEVTRLQALVRAAQRSLGLPKLSSAGPSGGKIGKKTSRNKKRRGPGRAVRAIRALRQPEPPSPSKPAEGTSGS